MIVYLERKATKEDIKNASREFGDYLKIVVDMEILAPEIRRKFIKIAEYFLR